MRDASIGCSRLKWVIGVCNVDLQIEFKLDKEPERFYDAIESEIRLDTHSI
jgi:hypothetical protein